MHMQMPLYHLSIFIGVLSEALKGFYFQKVHSKLMKVCCCKFWVSGAKFIAVGQLECE